MAGTFSQIYIQVIFAVKGKENLLPWRDEVFKYMSGIVKNKGQKPIIVNGVTDHVHLFIGLKPAIALSDLVRDVKNNTSNFINEQKFATRKFSWQACLPKGSSARRQEGMVLFHMPIRNSIQSINIY